MKANAFFYLFVFVGAVLASSCKQDKSAGAFPDIHVPDGFVVESTVPSGMVKYPMFATLDNRGRMFVAESSGETTSTEDVLENPAYFIRMLEDTDSDGVYDKSVIYADKIPYAMGGTFYRGSFYAAAPPNLLRLTDTDGDGVADKREVLLSGWVLNHNAATLSGPFMGPDGWMYLCDARRSYDITTKEGKKLKGKGAGIWRCKPDGSQLEIVSSGGFDNTIEMAFMPTGETLGTMTYFTDPRDGFRDAVMHWVEGGVYPKDHSSVKDDKLKMTGDYMPVMTKLPRVSHAGIMRYRSGVIGKAYKGSLFTAEFNTGRVMRYQVDPDGATYKTETQAFMTSSIPDFHPTDVLEDADGSIMFVNTGGWFIAGCPLSVVAKKDIYGGIYRIRRKDAPKVDDPWGRKIDLQAMAVEDLTALLTDERHAVRDNAIEELVLRGEASVGALSNLLKSAKEPEVRVAAVFALYRVGTPEAIARVVSALDDQDAGVRVAAARSCGLAEARSAVAKLSTIVFNDEPAVQRQAATALGQIGDAGAVDRLLAASEKTTDRFVEHSITYSLITLANPQPLVHALSNRSVKVRKTALIALDQMDGALLKEGHILPFLRSDDELLRNTGIWVLMHHTDWSDIALTFLKDRTLNRELDEADKKTLTELIVAFSHDTKLQRWMATRLSSGAVADAEKGFLLDAMRQSPMKEFPAVWLARLGDLLRLGSPEIQERVLTLIEARRISGLDTRLGQIYANIKVSPSFRLKALSARMVSHPQLSDKEFSTLVTFLDTTQASTLRQSAVRILGQADLDEQQQLFIARTFISKADPFLLPGLVNVFEGSKSSEAGNALVAVLSSSPERLEMLSLPDLERIVKSWPSEIQQTSAALVKQVSQMQASRLSVLEDIEKSLGTGDVSAGRSLFHTKALCSTCHAVSGNGADFGPDLTNIGEIRSEHDILEAIVYPSASFAREYETSRVVTASTTYTGIVKEQLPESILVESAPGVAVRIAISDIKSIAPQELSLMPPALHQQLSTQELSDLMAYLKSLPDGLGHLRSVKR